VCVCTVFESREKEEKKQREGKKRSTLTAKKTAN
jgi:hypothetical protein